MVAHHFEELPVGLDDPFRVRPVDIDAIERLPQEGKIDALGLSAVRLRVHEAGV